MMGRNIEKIIAGLPKVRRIRISNAAKKMAGEMVSYADSLAAVRKVFSKTQVEVGEGLGLAQNAVSQLERRKDLRVSTLVRYIDALGGELDFVIRAKDGSKVVLSGMGTAGAGEGKNASKSMKTSSRRATAPSRR